MNDKNMAVLINVIGAVESGGQIYGRRRYDAYAAPYTNTPNEHTITLGWAQNYGSSAKRLISMIRAADPVAFAEIDYAGSIGEMLQKDWTAIRWNPTSAQKDVLIRLISSKAGKECQDKLFADQMEPIIADCEKTYTKSVKAVMMYCEIRHLGGKGPADRIFKRCAGNYSLDSIMNSLRQDQNDPTSSNQVGDTIFWSRHEKCREFIEKYAVKESKEGEGMSKTESAIRQMEAWARDDSHGYDQVYRWGERGDYDCSAAVITAWEKAGVPVKSYGASYTGNMLSVFLKCGFTDVTGSVDRSNGSGMKRGDVLLASGRHVAMYCGNGQEVEASINEHGGISGGQPGDQTGAEFLIRGYRNYPWTHVLRYPDSGQPDSGGEDSNELRAGSTGEAVKEMQTMLIAVGYSCGKAGADGRFGKDTDAALRKFQKDYKLRIDGVYGKQSKSALVAAYQKRGWKATGTAICANNDVNIRKTPGGEIVGVLNCGNRFEIDGQTSGDWTHIFVHGVGVCWIYTNYIAIENAWRPTGTATCGGDDVKVRAKPKIDDNVLCALNEGQRFEVDGKKSGDWIHVKVAGVGQGFMHKSWVIYD